MPASAHGCVMRRAGGLRAWGPGCQSIVLSLWALHAWARLWLSGSCLWALCWVVVMVR